MEGGGAGGYNIPVSLSAASSYSVPQTANTPTYFVFGSAGARVGGDIQQNPSSYLPATATSAAAQGDAYASTEGSGVSVPGQGGGISTKQLYIVGAVIVAAVLIGAVVIARRH